MLRAILPLPPGEGVTDGLLCLALLLVSICHSVPFGYFWQSWMNELVCIPKMSFCCCLLGMLPRSWSPIMLTIPSSSLGPHTSYLPLLEVVLYFWMFSLLQEWFLHHLPSSSWPNLCLRSPLVSCMPLVLTPPAPSSEFHACGYTCLLLPAWIFSSISNQTCPKLYKLFPTTVVSPLFFSCLHVTLSLEILSYH